MDWGVGFGPEDFELRVQDLWCWLGGLGLSLAALRLRCSVKFNRDPFMLRTLGLQWLGVESVVESTL